MIASIDAVANRSSIEKAHPDTSSDNDTIEEDFKLPCMRFRPLSLKISPFRRPSTSPITRVPAVHEIVSPHPNRPTSSQSRKRFSKILDLDQSQSILDYYTDSYTPSHRTYRKLEKVDEAMSPLRHIDEDSPVAVSTSRKPAKSALSVGPPSTRERWSGVTSHDKSTVESLLEKHIECLGLKPGDSSASQSFVQNDSLYELEQIPEVPSIPSFGLVSSSGATEQQFSDIHRPTSLTSTAQRQLMPRKLFANGAEQVGLKLPFASSESDPRFSLAWTEDRLRPSYGWLTLPSDSNILDSNSRTPPTLLSGDLADVESGQKKAKFRLIKHNSPDKLASIPPDNQKLSHDTSARASVEEQKLNRSNSRRHRKMKIHIKPKTPADTSLSSDWRSTDDSTQDEPHLRKLGMSRVPISVVDGFAELSGESASASLRSLDSKNKPMMHRSPDTWSTILAAMPLPKRTFRSLRRQDSRKTTTSNHSQRRIAEPINTSRLGSTRKSSTPQQEIPKLAKPDLGPIMRLSQFDLSDQFRIRSPTYKQSSFSEPKDLLQVSPQHLGGDGTRNRDKFYSFRNVMPSSMRSFTFSPDHSQKPYHLARACQMQKTDSIYQQPDLPETVAMSDFAYQKHRMIEKLKGWCRRRRVQKKFGSKRRSSLPPGGFIV